MSWTAPALEDIAQLVGKQTGLSFVNRQDSAEIGIRRAMKRARHSDFDGYAAHLAAHAEALDDLITELTVGETYFFREPAQFRAIEQHILPDIRQRRGPAPVRIWSAGCATGEEAYSLAMLLDKDGDTVESQVIATDISRTALMKARRACYGAWSLRNDDARAAERWLEHTGDGYCVTERVRQRVTLAYLNLALDCYPSYALGIWNMDLILCRNVLIYLERDTVRRIAQRFHDALADGGWLITASADPPLWDDAPLEAVRFENCLAYRRRAWQPTPILVPIDEPPPMIEPDPPPRVHREPPAAVEDDAAAAVAQVRTLANVDPVAAAEACKQALRRHRLHVELHYLNAVVLLGLDRADEAIEALRRMLYLDRKSALAHFMLASLLQRRGDRAGAAREYRNTRDLCAMRPADEPVPLADGESAGRLAEIAAAELALLEQS